MNEEPKIKSGYFAIGFVAALVFVLLIQGAIPFLTAPTLGQAIWATGFSQSFANNSLFSIYAHNFGAPEPAAISFGLAGAWPASVFIRMGMSAIDAYTSMAALWLTLAFVSAYKIGRYLNVSPFPAILGALVWMTMPVIWAHAGYSMLSIGIGLLAFYFFSMLRLLSIGMDDGLKKWRMIGIIVQYFFACLISVFMDGYSFMMFAVGSTVLVIVAICMANKMEKLFLCKAALPVHIFCFISAYLLFSSYIGKSEFEASPIDFFRGWGVDVVFMLIPTKGIHWVMDLFSASVSRSEKDFWGDASVWTTSFCIPIFLVAAFAAWKAGIQKRKEVGFLLIAICGVYMALGPSLKFNSERSVDMEMSRTMPEEYAVAPTGSGLLSANIPGFKNMRASYRWLALGGFGAWALSLLLLAENEIKYKVCGSVFFAVVALLNIPDIPKKTKGYIANRSSFFSIEHDLVSDMVPQVVPGEKVAFLPWRNDFLVNYLASKLKINVYNIGGDKNLAEARQHWPETMRQFPMASVDDGFSRRVLVLLARKEADVVVFPYVDMLWAAHRWPHPTSFKSTMMPIVEDLKRSDAMEVVEREYFSIVRLSDRWKNSSKNEILKNSGFGCMRPICIEKNGFEEPFHSRVGELNGKWLESSGNKGMLLFGPYVPMGKGNYELIIYGVARTTGAAWVDVASDLGRKVHGKFYLVQKAESSDYVLVNADVALDDDVRDLEIRVYVDSEDDVSLRGYSFKQR